MKNKKKVRRTFYLTLLVVFIILLVPTLFITKKISEDEVKKISY